MKVLIIVDSTHRGNTMKIAKAMAEAVPAKVVTVEGSAKYELDGFDVVGFGGGIYFGKHSAKLINLAEKRVGRRTATFVFSTSGTGSFEKNNSALAGLLKRKSRAVLGSFGCKGLDEFAIFRLFGGLNKGRPDGTDLENARRFMLSVADRYCELE